MNASRGTSVVSTLPRVSEVGGSSATYLMPVAAAALSNSTR